MDDLSIGALVFRRRKDIEWLVLHRADNGRWEFSKGHPHEGESEEQTLQREIEEELGIEEVRRHPTFREAIVYPSKSGKRRVIVLYLIEVKDDIVRSEEHDAHRWLVRSKVQELMTYADVRRALERAEQTLKK